MTLWEIAACVEGFNQANGGEQQIDPMSNAEFDAMLEKHQQSATTH